MAQDSTEPAQTTSPPAPAPAAPPADKAPLSDWELPDTHYDPEFDEEVAPGPKAEPAASTAAGAPTTPGETPVEKPAEPGQPAQPRDPQTGQFLPKAPEHPQWLVSEAIRLGVHPTQIQGVQTDHLNQWVYQEGQRRAALSAAQQAHQNAVQFQQRPPADPLPLDLPADQYDPKIIAAFQQMKGKLLEQQQSHQQFTQQAAQAFQAIQAQHFLAQQHQQAQHQEAFRQRMDQMLAEYPELKGRAHEVAQHMDFARQAGIPGGEKEHFASAVKLLGAKAQPAEEPEPEVLAERKKDWKEGIISRATRRPTREVKGDGAALKRVASYLRENGMTEQSDDQVLNGLPE